MRFLVDTNIFLEVILEQEKAEGAKAFLAETEHDLFMSDYSLHSIGLICFRRKRHESFRQFLRDVMLNVGMTIASLSVEDMESIIDTTRRFNLDFDDAYQYTIAEKYDLTIVSFDADFDSTKLGRKTPAEIIKG